MEKVTVRVPATTANLGVGFDTMGCALGLYNTLSFSPAPELGFSGCDTEYQTPDNLAYLGFKAVYEHLGQEIPGVHIDISAHDLDRLARHPDDPLDIVSVFFIFVWKNNDIKPFGILKMIGQLIHDQVVAVT